VTGGNLFCSPSAWQVFFQKSTKTEHYSFSACYMMLLKNGIKLLKLLAFPMRKQ
jgi:hypothetical protein